MPTTIDHTTEVDNLITLANRTLIDPIWLDETVYITTADTIDDLNVAERLASDINNGGFARQIRYLLNAGWTPTTLTRRINDLATHRRNGTRPW